MSRSIKYSEVLSELEEIVERMNKGEIPLDELGDTVKKAAKKIRFLRQKLKATEAEISGILDELEDENEA